MADRPPVVAFPDRSSLIEALYRDQVDEVVKSARSALEITDPWQGPAAFLTQVMQFLAENRGLRELSTGASDGLALGAHARTHIAPIVAELLARAHEAGVVRPDVTERDLALTPVMTGAVIHTSRHAEPELWRRMLAIVLDGLRSGRTLELPGAAPDNAYLARIISTT